MTLQELLKANGMSDEGIAAVEAGMKEHKIYTASRENLDIRYDKLKTEYDGLSGKHTEAQALIQQLQQATAGNEEQQRLIAEYEVKFQKQQEELDKARLDAAVKVALLEAKASDIDYMTFKLREKGELALDESGKIKGWDEKLAGLRTQFPTQFEGSGAKVVEPNRLPDTDPNGGGLTRQEILRKPYAERAQLFADNPEAYKEAMKN